MNMLHKFAEDHNVEMQGTVVITTEDKTVLVYQFETDEDVEGDEDKKIF